MTKTKEIVNKLIDGQTISIIDDEQAKEVREELRKIKTNCTIVLKQLKERLAK